MFKCFICNDRQAPEDVMSRIEYKDKVYGKKVFLTFLFTDKLDVFIHLCKKCTGIAFSSIGRASID